ncbi:MAG: hypothetical protein GDA56_18235 [Hormoscilla sp. GM7CHS1pb]|nr:hypothetical protein [Hormoscilla sp. GM7CHS1pb]
MSIKSFSTEIAVQLLATKSRQADLSSIELCNVHFEMGKLLAYKMLEDFPVTEISIRHVQGIRQGVELAQKDDFVIVSMMRAGLYAAEGIRSVFSNGGFILYSSPEDLVQNLNGKIIILVDSVINTGKSIERVVTEIKSQNPAKIVVATLVMQQDTTKLADQYREIDFYALRFSANKYVGKGATDTGNRLFNTISS